jgi:plasmid stabilization system protein ParE
LRAIRKWIEDESGSSETAARFTAELVKMCKSLRAMPERFAHYPFASSWRMMPHGNYLIFYKIAEKEVRIGRIRHAAKKPFRG